MDDTACAWSTRSCDASARAAAASVASARGGGDRQDQAQAEIRHGSGKCGHDDEDFSGYFT